VSTHAAAAHPDGASAAAASLSLRVWWSTAAADGPVSAAQWYHMSWRLAWPGRCSWAHASGPSRAPDGQGGHAACFVFVSPLVVLTLAAAAGLDCQTWRRRRLGAGLSESDMDAVCVRVRACVRACACVCACVRALERVKKGRRDGRCHREWKRGRGSAHCSHSFSFITATPQPRFTRLRGAHTHSSSIAREHIIHADSLGGTPAGRPQGLSERERGRELPGEKKNTAARAVFSP